MPCIMPCFLIKVTVGRWCAIPKMPFAFLKRQPQGLVLQVSIVASKRALYFILWPAVLLSSRGRGEKKNNRSLPRWSARTKGKRVVVLDRVAQRTKRLHTHATATPELSAPPSTKKQGPAAVLLDALKKEQKETNSIS